MITLLKKISKRAIELKQEQIDYSNKQKENQWIGFSPASNEEISDMEDKLKVNFPEEYKEFLSITNGFSQTTITEPEFFSVDKIDWLVNVDKELVEIWKENGLNEVGVQLERAILIADSNKEQQFLLIAPNNNEKWKFWKFANWNPGEEEYDNIETYFKEVLEFLIDIKNEFK